MRNTCKGWRYPYNAKGRELQKTGVQEMKFSANQAAEETGKNISTITRAIKSGKLSADKNKDGSYSIDASELFRVYGAKDCTIPAMQRDATQQDSPRNPEEMNALRELAEDRKMQVEKLQEKLEKAEKRLDEERQQAREERESSRSEREKFMLWLEHKPAEKETGRELTPSEQPPETKQATRRRWWQRENKVKA